MLERGAGRGPLRVVSLGQPALDQHLPGGGLPLGALHEIVPERAEWDDAAATGFCLALLARLGAAVAGPVLWAARGDDLHGPGLRTQGFDPGRLILARAQGDLEVCWALEEGLRCRALAAVVGEVAELERSAGRRLQLAAEAAGVTCFLLRRRRVPRRRAEPPSAAVTRWQVAPAPSGPGSFGPGSSDSALMQRLPGRPRWQVELLRCRGAAAGRFLVEGDDATGGFTLATALRDGSLAPEPLAPSVPDARLAG